MKAELEAGAAELSRTSHWYKDAIIYQLHVRAFHDSGADGIGDFRGLLHKLDYLQDLGVTAIWLLPFYPSPLRDDGYDIADYTSIHPAYGTLRDFRAFLREAHRRDIHVITELVLNHTSEAHPWFQRARRAPPGSPERDFYVWSETPDRYADARIIFKDFESSNWAWDPVAGAYYWHRFYSHQPDLNFDNPEVRRSMLEVLDFWLDMGVDGLRLDAVPYLFEREGTTGENLPETHAFLKEIREHVDRRHPDRMLLAEANQWPDDAAAYFGNGDEAQMAFHFPVMPRMFMAVRMEDRFPVIDILAQTPDIPETCQWALFLRNHDELTLEMVTDEERDYMYRAYAEDPQARINLGIRRRLAPLVGNDRRVVELLNALLFSLPGTPVVYYGDEVGMGDNIYLGDRNGVRTPMQWSADRNAGFSRSNPQRLFLPVIIDPEYHFEALNVEAQQSNPHSLLWWTKRLVALRKRFEAFGRGSLEFLYPENRKVLAFMRRHGDERVLIVANLARTAQYVELDMAEFRGMVPVEMLGRAEFPPIGELPYLLTIGPYGFYWFSLEPQREPEARVPHVPVLTVRRSWEELFDGRRPSLEKALPDFIRARRWFRGKARRISSITVSDAVPIPRPNERRGMPAGFLTFLRVDYREGESETYVLPLAVASGLRARELEEWVPQAVVAKVRLGDEELVLHDALWDQGFCRGILAAVSKRRRLRGDVGKLIASPTRAFSRIAGRSEDLPEPHVLAAEQTNTSVAFGDRVILKLFRRAEEGINPDLEVGRHLTERGFSHSPAVAGSLEYTNGARPLTVGILQDFVANEGDAWQYTLDSLGRYFEQIEAAGADAPGPELPRGSLLDLAEREPPQEAHDTIGVYLESARLLGERTADLHHALAAPSDDPDLAPEPVTAMYQRSLYQSMRALTARVLQLVRARRRDIPETERLLGLEDELLRRFRRLLDLRITAQRIRGHGDYHLGQVLYTGNDFVIVDFEGEPARPIGERRIKRIALRDVAGMIRSFHYAAYTASAERQREAPGVEGTPRDAWARHWYLWVSSVFLGSYLASSEQGEFLPASREEREVLLDALLLEKAVYEVGYEINNRPEWVGLPMRALVELLEASA